MYMMHYMINMIYCIYILYTYILYKDLERVYSSRVSMLDSSMMLNVLFRNFAIFCRKENQRVIAMGYPR